MPIWMTTMTSDLYFHGRSDPEYYLPRHTQVEADLNLLLTVPMRELGTLSCSAFYPAATHLYSEDGMPFLRCVDIIDFPLISQDQPFARIPEDFVSAHSSIRSLSAGDIVISKVGTPCYASLLAEDMPTAAMTRTVLGMSKISEELINPFYLIAFLRSRYGFDQLMRERELTIQYQLTLERTRKVRVYLPNMLVQDEIGKTVQAYYQAQRDGIEAYKNAQHLLESKLGLDKLSFQKPVGFTSRFSTIGLNDTFSAGRIDSQCFAPDALFYEKWLGTHAHCERLGHLLQSKAKGRQQVESSQGQTDYCSIKHISGQELVEVSKCFPSKDSPIARTNDLLLAITGATIGKIGIVKRYAQLAFSGDLLMLRAKSEINPHYLLLALDHRIGQVQFSRWITGSTNGHLAPRDVGRVLIPRLGETIERRIAELVEKSLSKKVEAEKLLEKAKGRVEQLIEDSVRS
jgi:type I restriction enzyme, S subunit